MVPFIVLLQRWSEWRSASETAPHDPLAADPERQTRFSLSFLLHNTTDPYVLWTTGVTPSDDSAFADTRPW